MKAKDLIKLIEEDGWFLVRQKGSHKQFKQVKKRIGNHIGTQNVG
jgi:predicted RNA binding protein YcfA (HicA-like mRNA interferase family)